MNKLSLPGFDPSQPLGFHLWMRTIIHPYYGVLPGGTVEVALNLWVDNFVGMVRLPGTHEVEDRGLPYGATYLFELDIVVPHPTSANLNGSEGWFYPTGGGGLVYDCIVTYTPLTLGDASSAVGHFS